jgi:putative ABC transport system permease protein
MWRSYLASALGNLVRNRLHAAITVFGLALGVAAALMIGLYVRDELGFDHFIPGHNDAYLLTTHSVDTPGGDPPWNNDQTTPELAARLKLELPGIAAVARVDQPNLSNPPRVAHGQTRDWETGFVWADPDLFVVLPLKALAGAPRTALRTPDAVVLTRTAARKYFGRDTPVGETLMVAFGTPAADFKTLHPMRVTAVVEDLPSNSSFRRMTVFGSGLAPYSNLAFFDRSPGQHLQQPEAYTFVRLKPGASAAAFDQRLQAFAAHDYPPSSIGGQQRAFHLTPLTGIHFAPSSEDPIAPRGDLGALSALAAIGVLILVSASINFVILMTARAGRRAVETGVRKAAGARRGDLLVQFLGETMLYVAIAVALAVVATELVLPWVNAKLGRTIVFDYLGDPALAAALVGATLVLGLLAGIYPALVLSAFKPATALKGPSAPGAAGELTRKALVTLQFAIMIGLVVATVTLWRQTLFSLNDRLRVDGSKILVIAGGCDRVFPPGARRAAIDPAQRAFRQQVSALPGVEAAICTSSEAFSNDGAITPAQIAGRPQVMLNRAPVDFGGLEFFGLKPLAGRFFRANQGGDLSRTGPSHSGAVVLNETAARALGFASPSAAVGHVVTWKGLSFDSATPKTDYVAASQIIGVTPDFTLNTGAPVKPLMFMAEPGNQNIFMARLGGARLPETLPLIDKAWTATGHGVSRRQFLDRVLQEMYANIVLQSTAVGLGAGVALVIAALGLFGLSAHAAEQRTKEVGVRKAMGASTADIVRLLLWQFNQPVLWANLIAWPVAWWAMTRWLQGFAYHVDLPPWLFLAAGGGAILIACATVLAHALIVARAAPVTALRYE